MGASDLLKKKINFVVLNGNDSEANLIIYIPLTKHMTKNSMRGINQDMNLITTL